MKKLLIIFAAGCLGALANSLSVWALGKYAITQALGVSIAPALTPAWLYPRIVWGGIWGLLFILPLLEGKYLWKGTILSLFPTAAQLFIVFPHAGRGTAELELGMLTPLFVLVVNWIWGVTTTMTIKFAK